MGQTAGKTAGSTILMMGETYNVAVERKTSGAMEARIYAGLPVLGTTKSLHQVPKGTSAGWC